MAALMQFDRRVRRWGAVLVLLAAAVLAAGLFLPDQVGAGPHHRVTVLVAEFAQQDDLTAIAAQIQDSHPDAAYLVIPTVEQADGQRTEDADLIAAVRRLNDPTVMVAGVATTQQVVDGLPASTRVIDQNGTKLVKGMATGGGRVASALWAMALIAVGAVLTIIAWPRRVSAPPLVYPPPGGGSGSWSGGPSLSRRPVATVGPSSSQPATAPSTPQVRTAGAGTAGAGTAAVAEPSPAVDLGWWADSSTESGGPSSNSLGSSSSRPHSPRRRGAASLDLARFAGPAPVVGTAPQCPQCAAFTVTARPGGPARTAAPTRPAAIEYRCAQCGSTWSLAADGAWPAVVVRPRRQL